MRVLTNTTIAVQLRHIAALLDEQGVAFKPAAYRKAAQFIEDYEGDITKVGEVKDLKKLPGIGEAIARKIIEYRDTGNIEFLAKLMAEQGGLSADLMDIEGLGPKRVRQVQQELGIQTVAELMQAAEQGELQQLELWDEKLEQKVLANAKRVKERMKRFPREEVVDDVELLLRTIGGVGGVRKVGVAGSYRREKETVGDIDILLVTDNAQKVSDAIASLSIVRDVVAHGDKKISFDLHNGLRVDVRLVRADQWGAALMYFTGSKEHNITVRKEAIKHGWKLNEYGLLDGDEVLASETEEEIYERLGMAYIEPKNRV